MSVAPPSHTPPPGDRPPRILALTLLMIVIGGILLLPGLCALAFGVPAIVSGSVAVSDLPLVLLIGVPCLAVSAGGIFLIRRALR
jgi:hypothetical protein